MPCLLVLLILFFPRIILLLMFFLSDYLGRAFHHEWLIPILGFIFLPITTIVYAWEVNSGLPIAGINLVWLIIAVIADVGGWGGGGSHARRRW